MKTTTRFKNSINGCGSSLILLALTCFAISPMAQAVTPPPDGGYSGGNTAEGQNALLNLSTGTYNTAVGLYSLLSLSGGLFNTGVGAGTLLVNTADENTAIGAGALLSNINGSENTANGAFALFTNIATGNTAVGPRALLNNTTGGTLGNTQGFDVGPNVAVGWRALENNTIASANIAVGYQALASYTTGTSGTDVGLNTAVGFQTLANLTGPGAFSNNAFGYQALLNLTDGGDNVAIGAQALLTMITGNENLAVGDGAGRSITIGSNNICIGELAGSAITTANNVIAIGVGAENFSNGCYIANIFDTTSGGGTAVFINSAGKLGAMTSSRRFKDDIKPMDKASEALFALKPVSFHYKKEIDPERISQFGLVAEEVEKVDRDLVVRDKEGKPYSVRYDQVNAMLLNEFLKEHRKNEEQEATIARLQDQIEELRAGLQKVSTLLATRQPANELAVTEH
jgi:hypothetical protein